MIKAEFLRTKGHGEAVAWRKKNFEAEINVYHINILSCQACVCLHTWHVRLVGGQHSSPGSTAGPAAPMPSGQVLTLIYSVGL